MSEGKEVKLPEKEAESQSLPKHVCAELLKFQSDADMNEIIVKKCSSDERRQVHAWAEKIGYTTRSWYVRCGAKCRCTHCGERCIVPLGNLPCADEPGHIQWGDLLFLPDKNKTFTCQGCQRDVLKSIDWNKETHFVFGPTGTMMVMKKIFPTSNHHHSVGSWRKRGKNVQETTFDQYW